MRRHGGAGPEIRLLPAPRAALLGEVAQYESIFRPCYLRGPAGIIYLRGPAGIIVALAEKIT